MKIMIQIALIATVLGGMPAWAGLAESIHQAALDTNNSKNLSRVGDKVLLYGTQTNGKDTNGGKWACAKVVTVILNKVGAIKGVVTGVASVESKLKSWRKITDESDLRPGDVVVWTHRFKGNKDKSCTGGGTCHVGIYTSRGYFHNNPLGDSPTFGGFGLYLFSFKVAYRPPT